MLVRLSAAAALLALLAGCLPGSVNPVTPPEAGLDAPELLGLWRAAVEEDTVYIHVLRGEGAALEVVAVNHRADGGGGTDLYRAHVSAVGARRYVNLRPAVADANDGAPYWILGYEPGEDSALTLLFLSSDTLARAVTDGRLAGEVTGDSFGEAVRLTGSGQEIAAFLAATSAKELFDRTLRLEPVPIPAAAP